MNFLYSEEQQLLKDTVTGALKAVSAGQAVTTLAELGILGLLVAEEDGGSALGITEATIVVEAASGVRVREPVAGTILLAGYASNATVKAASGFADGTILADFVTGGNLRELDGRVSGHVTAKNLAALDYLAVPVTDDRIALVGVGLLAPTRLQPIELDEEPVSIPVDLPATDVRIMAAPGHRAALNILRCAELVGASAHAFDLSVAYLKDRQQFGQPLGVNQALKHLAADCYMTLESMRVAVDFAAIAFDTMRAKPDDVAAQAQAERALHVMLGLVPGAAREIAEMAVQFHGGIGLTWEYELNGFLRHIIRVGMSLGHGSRSRSALLDMQFGKIHNADLAANGSLRLSKVIA